MRRAKQRSAPTSKDIWQFVGLVHAFFLTWGLIVVGYQLLLNVAYFEPMCKRAVGREENFIAFHYGTRNTSAKCQFLGPYDPDIGSVGGPAAALVAWTARPIALFGGMWANFRLWKFILEKTSSKRRPTDRKRREKSAIWLAIDNQPYARNPHDDQVARALATIIDQPESFLICSSDEESLLVSGDDGSGLLVERTDQADQIYAAEPSRLDAPTAATLLKRFAQRDPDWHTPIGWTEKA